MISSEVSKLSNENLRVQSARIENQSRKLKASFIEHIAEIAKRNCFIDWGFSSFYDFLVQEYHFFGSSAYRRMQAAYALLQIPELKEDIATGALNLGQICSAQTAMRQEQMTNIAIELVNRSKFNDLIGLARWPMDRSSIKCIMT